jgi:hypothetical protein
MRIWELIGDYRAAHGHWPQDLTAPEGHTHSWRVLVAPYRVPLSNKSAVYSQIGYNSSEPWNTDRNIIAIHKLPLWGSLVCTSESRDADYPYTSYLMLKRSETSTWSVDRLPPDAVIIVESVKCGVAWGEPVDLLWEALWQDESPFGEGKLNSLHHGVVKALRVDGQVIDIPKDIGNEDLKRLLSGSIGDD